MNDPAQKAFSGGVVSKFVQLPPSKRRNVGTYRRKAKCFQCRESKKYCEPRDRVWPARCQRCQDKNISCSPPAMKLGSAEETLITGSSSLATQDISVPTPSIITPDSETGAKAKPHHVIASNEALCDPKQILIEKLGTTVDPKELELHKSTTATSSTAGRQLLIASSPNVPTIPISQIAMDTNSIDPQSENPTKRLTVNSVDLEHKGSPKRHCNGLGQTSIFNSFISEQPGDIHLDSETESSLNDTNESTLSPKGNASICYNTTRALTIIPCISDLKPGQRTEASLLDHLRSISLPSEGQGEIFECSRPGGKFFQNRNSATKKTAADLLFTLGDYSAAYCLYRSILTKENSAVQSEQEWAELLVMLARSATSQMDVESTLAQLDIAIRQFSQKGKEQDRTHHQRLMLQIISGFSVAFPPTAKGRFSDAQAWVEGNLFDQLELLSYCDDTRVHLSIFSWIALPVLHFLGIPTQRPNTKNAYIHTWLEQELCVKRLLEIKAEPNLRFRVVSNFRPSSSALHNLLLACFYVVDRVPRHQWMAEFSISQCNCSSQATRWVHTVFFTTLWNHIQVGTVEGYYSKSQVVLRALESQSGISGPEILGALSWMILEVCACRQTLSELCRRKIPVVTSTQSEMGLPNEEFKQFWQDVLNKASRGLNHLINGMSQEAVARLLLKTLAERSITYDASNHCRHTERGHLYIRKIVESFYSRYIGTENIRGLRSSHARKQKDGRPLNNAVLSNRINPGQSDPGLRALPSVKSGKSKVSKHSKTDSATSKATSHLSSLTLSSISALPEDQVELEQDLLKRVVSRAVDNTVSQMERKKERRGFDLMLSYLASPSPQSPESYRSTE